MNSPSKLIPIGFLLKAHGLKGELKVFIYNDESETLVKGLNIWLKLENSFKSFLVENIRGYKKNIIKLENLNDRDEANKLLKEKIYVSRSDFPSLNDGEFYLNDLIGFNIYDTENISFGILVDVMCVPNQEILVIKYNEKEILLPNNDNFVRLFDFKNKKIIVDKIKQFIL